MAQSSEAATQEELMVELHSGITALALAGVSSALLELYAQRDDPDIDQWLYLQEKDYLSSLRKAIMHGEPGQFGDEQMFNSEVRRYALQRATAIREQLGMPAV